MIPDRKPFGTEEQGGITMCELMIAAAALPLGDDTPIALYAVLGIVALVLVIASVLMNKKAKQNDDQSKTDKK